MPTYACHGIGASLWRILLKLRFRVRQQAVNHHKKPGIAPGSFVQKSRTQCLVSSLPSWREVMQDSWWHCPGDQAGVDQPRETGAVQFCNLLHRPGQGTSLRPLPGSRSRTNDSPLLWLSFQGARRQAPARWAWRRSGGALQAEAVSSAGTDHLFEEFAVLPFFGEQLTAFGFVPAWVGRVETRWDSRRRPGPARTGETTHESGDSHRCFSAHCGCSSSPLWPSFKPSRAIGMAASPSPIKTMGGNDGRPGRTPDRPAGRGWAGGKFTVD